MKGKFATPSETLLRTDTVMSNWLNKIAAEGKSKLTFKLWYSQMLSRLTRPEKKSSHEESVTFSSVAILWKLGGELCDHASWSHVRLSNENLFFSNENIFTE